MNLFRKAFLCALVALLIAGSPAPSSAVEFEIFFDRSAFLAETGARLATPNGFPLLGDTGGAPYQNGELIYRPVGSGRLDFREWTTELPIDAGGSTVDIAIFGTENLDLSFVAAVHSFGIEFSDDPGTTGTTPSTFAVTAFLDQIGAPPVEVASFTFSPQDQPGMRFFGLQTDELLNRVEIRETSAQNENEFFGKVYTEAPIRRMFITPEPVSGDLSTGPGVDGELGIEAGDAICRHWAAAGGLPNANGFVAFLSDSENDAVCRVRGLFSTNENNCDVEGERPDAGPWRRADDLSWGGPIDLVLDDFAGAMRRPTAVDVFGNELLVPPTPGSIFTVGVEYFTGSNDGVAASALTCSDWTSSQMGQLVRFGDSLRTGSDFGGSDFARDCSESLYLLCFEMGAGAPLPREPSVGRLAFVTRATGSGDLLAWPAVPPGPTSPLEAADAICQEEATAANLEQPETFKAWLSTDDVAARDRFVNNGSWRRPDNVRIADSLRDLTDGTVQTSFSRHADGGLAGLGSETSQIWTGTDGDGTSDSRNCMNWTSEGPSAACGATNRADTGWTERFGNPCNLMGRLICLSDAVDPLFVFGDGFETGDTGRWSAVNP